MNTIETHIKLEDTVAYACLFMSGAAALIYEVCWIRTSTLIFGSTSYAMSTVLAVFFLGLALGSYLFGRLSLRTASPLRLYALLELGTGILALASPASFQLADNLYGETYRTVGGTGAVPIIIRIALVSIILLPPTVLMGGTLPLFCRQYVFKPSGIIRSVGFLYGINTLGAALGCIAAGMIMLPYLGTQNSINAGVVLSFLAALGAAALGLRVDISKHSQRLSVPINTLTRRAAVAGLLLFVTGFVALGNEVLWTRHLALLIGNTVYTYTLTLTAVLVGIVLGSWFAAVRFDRSTLRTYSFGLLQILNGLLVLLLMLIPDGFWRGLGPLPLATYFFLLLPPAVLSGISFPLAVRIVVEDPELAGSGVGSLTAMNTLGGIAGSLTVGFILLPGPGQQITLLFTTGLSVLAGVAAWFLLDRDASPSLRLTSVTAAVIAWLILPPLTGTRIPADFLWDKGQGETLIAHREGLSSNLAVIETAAEGRVLEIDRLWQGMARRHHQSLAAHVPMLLHPGPERVLVLGVGAGQTASRFLMYDIKGLDCIDIEPGVFDIIREHFDSAWMNDDRVSLIYEDGRNFVMHTRENYDVISIEVGQLYRPGVPLFYTLDFYQHARARLKPGGFLSQFVPIAFLTPDRFRSVVATFLQAFPRSFLWYNRAELLLIGINAPKIELDGSRLELLSGGGAVERDLHFVLWGGPQHSLYQRTVFLGSFLAGPRGLAALAAGATLYRDDRPVLDYALQDLKPDQTNEIPTAALLRQHLDSVEVLGNLELSNSELTEITTMRDKNLGDLAANALLRKANLLAQTITPNQLTGLLIQAVRENPDNFAVNLALAESLMRQQRFEDSLKYYQQAVRLRRDDRRARYGLIRVQERLR